MTAEWRKHFTQMMNSEKEAIRESINNQSFKHTYHSNNRLIERNISDASVLKTIKYGKIVEFHYKNGDARVLLRGTNNTEGYSICVVVSLTNKEIRTIYKNSFSDNHDTLHNEIYDNKIDIMKYIKVS